MPKLRENPQEAMYRKIVAKIMYYQSLLQLDKEQVAMACHIDRSTYYKRLQRAGSFRLEELIRLAQRFHISIADLVSDQEPGDKAS